jgi:hypothetical protein
MDLRAGTRLPIGKDPNRPKAWRLGAGSVSSLSTRALRAEKSPREMCGDAHYAYKVTGTTSKLNAGNGTRCGDAPGYLHGRPAGRIQGAVLQCISARPPILLRPSMHSSILTIVELVAINRLWWVHNWFAREFTTATIRCRIIERDAVL